MVRLLVGSHLQKGVISLWLMVNRVSGCMSVAGIGRESHSRGTIRVRGSRRGRMFRARGLDGSLRNGDMLRTSVR